MFEEPTFSHMKQIQAFFLLRVMVVTLYDNIGDIRFDFVPSSTALITGNFSLPLNEHVRKFVSKK
jgi:hypothetical protein